MALGAFTAIGPAVATAAAAVATQVLTLGGIGFGIEDLPERIPLGGTQGLAVHQYVGGALDIQTLGAFDKRIDWEATFMYGDALGRAQAVDAMRRAGKAVLFQLDTMSVQVVIASFEFDYCNPFRVPYRISLQPAALLTMDGSGPAPVATTTSPVALLGQTPQETPQAALTPIALANPATKAQSWNVGTLFGAAASTSLAQIINVLAPAGPGGIVNAVLQATHLVQAGDTLPSLALRYYGNAAAWTRIANANGIFATASSIVLSAGMQLIIPNPTRPPVRS